MTINFKSDIYISCLIENYILKNTICAIEKVHSIIWLHISLPTISGRVSVDYPKKLVLLVPLNHFPNLNNIL